jgi:ABC-type multidrug transport system permease subunit
MRLRVVRQLFLSRLREAFREPEVIFWVFVFPLLLALGLGIAFRNKPPDQIPVAVEQGEAAATVTRALQGEAFKIDVLSREECARRLRLGKVSLVVVAGGSYEYLFDPTRPESILARTLVDDALQRAAGRKDPVQNRERHFTEPGARYIDFLVPGILGMSLMSGGMWGVGFVTVDMRIRKVLKRLVATPMRKSEFLSAIILSRLLFMVTETALLLLFGWLVFDIVIRGAISTTLLVGLLGALCFGSLGLLVASRAQKIETVSGLMNLVMMPMFVFSGIFFSADRFPDVIQPAVRALPLTALNDALRAVIIEGADLASQAGRLAYLALVTAVCFTLSLRWFRWT